MMDEPTMAILDAMAEKIEALTARVEAAEKQLAEECSCKEWETWLRTGAGDAAE